MKTYYGTRGPQGCTVRVWEHDSGTGGWRDLDPRTDLANHSPSGFGWAYHGSGSAQLAIALLADSLGDEFAKRHYQLFKTDIVACLPHERWQLDELEIRHWVNSQHQEST